MPKTKSMKEITFTAKEIKELLRAKIAKTMGGGTRWTIRDIDPEFSKTTQGFGSNEFDTETFEGIRVTVISEEGGSGEILEE